MPISPIDDLRNTLLSRAKQQQPAAPQAQGAQGNQSYAPAGPAMKQVYNDRQPPIDLSAQMGSGEVLTKLPQPDVGKGLWDAISGGLKDGMSKPQTGLIPPAWPPIPMPMGPGEIPIGMPNSAAKVPPRWKRFETGQHMQEAIRNNYNPNPTLIRILSEGGGKY